MAEKLSPSAQKVQDELVRLGFDLTVVEKQDSTRSAAEAAEAVGCQVGQIAKSLIFRGKASDRPVLVIASGANLVDEKAVRDLIGEKIGRADADFVRAKTGFAIGGVPPVGHKEKPVCVIDEDLFNYDTIWAAAGTPRAVFSLTPAQLEAMTGGLVGAIRKERPGKTI